MRLGGVQNGVGGVQNGETAAAGVEREKRETREKYGTGKYIPVFSGFPVLPDTLCRQGAPDVCRTGNSQVFLEKLHFQLCKYHYICYIFSPL